MAELSFFNGMVSFPNSANGMFRHPNKWNKGRKSIGGVNFFLFGGFLFERLLFQMLEVLLATSACELKHRVFE